MGQHGQVITCQVQFERDAEQAHFSDAIAEKTFNGLVPGLVHAILQQTVERPPQHLLQFMHPAEKDVTPQGLALMLGKHAHEVGQGTLANPPLTADKPDFEIPPHTGLYHAVQALNLLATTDKELNRDGLARSERA